MESLSDTNWDAVISGTGLQQSLLALALSRSDKKILHVDPNGFYGGAEAALSLDEVDEWAAKHSASDDGLFAAARVVKEKEDMSTRGYTIALAPQFIHAKSELVSQLVSSKAFRQIEFLAVGSFFIAQPASDPSTPSTLSRIPSTREDVFSNTSIPARAKRALMKCLKFVLDYDSEANVESWKPQAGNPLSSFLASEFKLDASLQSYVITLTLSLDGNISVEDGLKAIHRHMTSIGIFGAGFAAVYPKWGGLSEIAQVGCRAGAVGGAVYMLGTGIQDVLDKPSSEESDKTNLEVKLNNDITVRTKKLVQSSSKAENGGQRLKRLTAVINSRLSSLFEVVVEGAPPPAVAVIAFPSGSVTVAGSTFEYPIYAMAHSSITGECPDGQCVVYLSTVATSSSEEALEYALSSLLSSLQSGESESLQSFYRLHYEQAAGPSSTSVDGSVVTVPGSSLALAFDDSTLQPVRDAWELLRDASEEETEYMVFEDREGQDDEDVYE